MESSLKKVSLQDPEYNELKKQRDPLLEGIEEFQKKLVHDKDEVSHLYLFYHEGKAIGTARIRPTQECLKYERVAVCRDWQGFGIAKLMTQSILENYRNDGRDVIVHAFPQIESFYAKCGFQVLERVTEDGFTLTKMIYKFT